MRSPKSTCEDYLREANLSFGIVSGPPVAITLFGGNRDDFWLFCVEETERCALSGVTPSRDFPRVITITDVRTTGVVRPDAIRNVLASATGETD